MIAIGCIVRNRAWILPEYLEAISKIDYINKQYLFLENDSSDNTIEILGNFSRNHPTTIKRIKVSDREDWHRNGYWTDGFKRLSGIRNQFLEMFLETNAGYLLSIDSDVIVTLDILNKLLEFANEDTIVGAVISNIPNKPVDGNVACNFMVIGEDNYFVHPSSYQTSGVMDVDMIGAVYLIPRKAIEDGVRYEANPHGEDIGFCINAKKKGYKMKAVMDIVCDHRMVDKFGT